MIQLTNKELLFDEAQIQEAQREFTDTNCVFLPQFLTQTVHTRLLKKLEATRFLTKFEGKSDAEFGKVLFVPPDEPVIFMFHLLMNNLNLFELIRRITKCSQIGNFSGRIHRSQSGGKHEIDWHGDNADFRLVGLTLNLGTERFTGGEFQLREKNSEKILRKIGQTEAGDAFIFRISPDLQHCLTALNAGTRTVGVGWFRAEPDFKTFAKNYFQSF
jgi:hypothetical protein